MKVLWVQESRGPVFKGPSPAKENGEPVAAPGLRHVLPELVEPRSQDCCPAPSRRGGCHLPAPPFCPLCGLASGTRRGGWPGHIRLPPAAVPKACWLSVALPAPRGGSAAGLEAPAGRCAHAGSGALTADPGPARQGLPAAEPPRQGPVDQR